MRAIVVTIALVSLLCGCKRSASEARTQGDDEIRVRVNIWVGCAGGLVANGGLDTEPKSPFDKAGMKVSFKVIDDWTEGANALANNNVDVMLTTTDVWARDFVKFKEKGVKARAFMLVDFSTGADGVIARAGINGIEDLIGKRIAYPEFTPSHFLLWYGLKSNGTTLSKEAIHEIRTRRVKAADGIMAATLFAQKQADAAVTWDPNMTEAVQQRGGGAKKIYSTRDASRLIADILVVRDDFAARKPAVLRRFAAAWYEGVSSLKSQGVRFYELLGTMPQFGLDMKTAQVMLDGVDLSVQSDNAGFFGAPLGGLSVSDYERIFREAQTMYVEEGAIRDRTVNIEQTLNREILGIPKTGTAPPLKQTSVPCDTVGASFSTTELSIYFETNSSEIPYDGLKQVKGWAQGNAAYQNSIIRIEGHTDSRGPTSVNGPLSVARAEAVKNELVRNGLNAGSMCVAGYGSKKEAAKNQTAEGRQMNRRTEIKLYHRGPH